MRKLPALIALGATTTLLLAACTDASKNETDASPSASGSATFDMSSVAKDDAIAALVPAAVAADGKLTVGTNAEYAPAEFIAADGKTPTGYDVDIITAVATVLGLEAEVQSADFTSIIPALGSRYEVGISSFTIKPERIEQANMISYFNAGEQFGVQKGNPKNIDQKDLCGLRVAVETGTVEDEGAAELSATCVSEGKKAIEIMRFDSQADATTNLVGGKADVMYADSPVIDYAIEKTGGQIEELGEVFDSAPQGIVVAKNDTELAKAVQQAVQKLMDDGSLEGILDSWGNSAGALKSAELNPTS